MIKRALISAVLLLVGITAVAYPYVSDYLSRVNGSRVISAYKDIVQQKGEQFVREQLHSAKQYNDSLNERIVQNPSFKNPSEGISGNYYEQLNVNGVMGYLEIPNISVKIPIYHGTGEFALKNGVGHIEGTALPIGGNYTHSVLTAHTGLTNARFFTDLTAITKGDLFFIYVLNETLAYKVVEIFVIEPTQTSALMPVEDKDYCTLMTCTPYGINSHRLLVRGERTPFLPAVMDNIQKTKPASVADRLVRFFAFSTTAVMMCVILMSWLVKRKKG